MWWPDVVRDTTGLRMDLVYVRFYNTCYIVDHSNNTGKFPKYSDTQKFVVITLKVEKDGVSLGLCIQKMQRELQTV